mmetsp:Transcript_3572/g.5406  ORF Transcript_3572/g.5406 Transcript_3572/m.5406 type:complete len:189 (-) Transcript_3572:459-1025(-)
MFRRFRGGNGNGDDNESEALEMPSSNHPNPEEGVGETSNEDNREEVRRMQVGNERESVNEDEDDHTIIGFDDGNDIRRRQGGGLDDNLMPMWDTQNDEDAEQRRQNTIRREIESVQRSNFFHLFLLCLVPTTLLLVVVASILGEGDDCGSLTTNCSREPRKFMNAFTSRCICDSIPVQSKWNVNFPDP